MPEEQSYLWIEKSADTVLVLLAPGAVASLLIAFTLTQDRWIRLIVFASILLGFGTCGAFAGLWLGRGYIGGCWLTPIARKICLVIGALTVLTAGMCALLAGDISTSK